VPKGDIRALRHIARQRQKLVGMLASENNRLHKLLTDAGVRLAVVVSDLHGQSARAMVKAIFAGKSTPAVLALASERLKASDQELFDAIQADDLTPAHVFVLDELMKHIEDLEARIARFERQLLDSLKDYNAQLILMQTVPGIDVIGAAMLLVEIGPYMSVFGSAERLASWVGVCPGNNEIAGKRNNSRTPSQRQCLGACDACYANSLRPHPLPLRAQGQVPGSAHSQRPQALDRGHRTQIAAHPLCHAQEWSTLQGQHHQL